MIDIIKELLQAIKDFFNNDDDNFPDMEFA